MAKVLNLRTLRKAAARKAAVQQADENAQKFGRTKAERQLESARAAKAARDLDAHRRNT